MQTRKSLRQFIAAISLRRWIQTLSLILANAYFLSWLRFIPCGFLNCSNCALATFTCPLILLQRGAIFISMGMLGMMFWKIVGSIIVALAILLLFGAALGTWTCGWLCPFGFVQDLLHKIPTRKFSLPGWAGWFRLPLFALLVGIIPYLTRSFAFCDICPPGTITRLVQQASNIPLFLRAPEGIMALVSISSLGLFLFLALFINRPFCTLLCPIGGIYGLSNKFSGLFLGIKKDDCSLCRLCEKSCPQGLNPLEIPNHSSCTRCLECTDHCETLKVDLKNLTTDHKFEGHYHVPQEPRKGRAFRLYLYLYL